MSHHSLVNKFDDYSDSLGNRSNILSELTFRSMSESLLKKLTKAEAELCEKIKPIERQAYSDLVLSLTNKETEEFINYLREQFPDDNSEEDDESD